MSVNENAFPDPKAPPQHKSSLTLLREWREYWTAHGEIGLVRFVTQVENYIAGMHETIRTYNPDDAQLDHEKHAAEQVRQEAAWEAQEERRHLF